jgi:tRNA(Ile2) C34 agmatinyltransferase TiaS
VFGQWSADGTEPVAHDVDSRVNGTLNSFEVNILAKDLREYKPMMLEADKVLLTNGMEKWRCKKCGGLYDTKLRAQRTDNGSTGHGCRSR